MFLVAVARPRWDFSRNIEFDGKLGIWPVGHFGVAQRTTDNRDRGTPVWVNDNMTREIYREMLIKKLIPGIKEKWPHSTRKIIIQQDGARAHLPDRDPEFCAALEEAGLDAKLLTQPPNSPDCNVLDLGFFRAVQSFNDEGASNEKELIKNVTEAYNNYPPNGINRNFLMLQQVLNEILDHVGCNQFALPHMGKDKLEREGVLPIYLPVSNSVNRFVPDEFEEEDDSTEARVGFEYDDDTLETVETYCHLLD